MTNNEGTKASAISLTLLLCAYLAVPVRAQSTEVQVKSDNTKVNKRDQTIGAATADRQKMNAAYRIRTTKIARPTIADQSFPAYAHNGANSIPPEARHQANGSTMTPNDVSQTELGNVLPAFAKIFKGAKGEDRQSKRDRNRD